MLGVINYGAGNFRSLCNSLDFLKIPYQVILKASDIESVSNIILPGVGAFGDCMQRIESMGLVDRLKHEILEKKKLFLGICVGHQVLSTMGTEFQKTAGLGLLAGKTIRLDDAGGSLPIPHVGWVEVKQLRNSELFENIEDNATFYFVHSFYIDTEHQEERLATVSYGRDVTAAVNKNNIYGVQFHPEKSQKNGLQLLRNFSNMKECE